MSRSLLTRLPGLPRRVGLELRGQRLFYAEAVVAGSQPRLARVGFEDAREGESLDDLLMRIGGSRWLRNAEVILPIRHPELRIARLDLPALSRGEAKEVAGRRAIELAENLGEPSCSGFAIAAGKSERPAWLAACPEEFSRFTHRRWSDRGIQASRFISLQYALGSLSTLLPPLGDSQLRAFLDLADGYSTCVLADSRGWVFSRELSIKVTVDPRSREDGGENIERLAAELRRTFHYVASELRIGEVAEFYLSGDTPDLDGLKLALDESLGIPLHRLDEVELDNIPAGLDPAAACVLGLVHAPDPSSHDLLPREIRRGNSARVMKRRLAIATACVGMLALSCGAYWGITASSLQRQLTELETEWRQTQSERRESDSRIHERTRGNELEATYTSLSEPQPSWSGALESVGRLLPSSALLDHVQATRDDRWRLVFLFEFRGADFATAAAEAARFSSSLNASPVLRVHATETTKAPGRPEEDFVRLRVRIAAEIAPVEPSESIEHASDGSLPKKPARHG